jgi:diadenylate cyclase
VADFISNLLFVFERLNWLSVLDILLVAGIFFALLYSVRDTQAMSLLRGIIFLFVVFTLLTSLVALPAFSWLVSNALPALLIAVPVIFAPEIRRALERIGRAGMLMTAANKAKSVHMEQILQAIVSAAARLSARQHGALIVLQRLETLEAHVEAGVKMDADVTPELLLQIFYPNTPLHDGAVVIADGKLVAAACVMPLSSSGILNRTPERGMGLRHRAALGISEATDAIAVVVSEETGSISIAHSGRMIRGIDPERLENILMAFYRPYSSPQPGVLERIFPRLYNRRKKEEEK